MVVRKSMVVTKFSFLCQFDILKAKPDQISFLPWQALLKGQLVPSEHAVKPVYNGHSQKDLTLVFKTNYRITQVRSIANCSKGSIQQYF